MLLPTLSDSDDDASTGMPSVDRTQPSVREASDVESSPDCEPTAELDLGRDPDVMSSPEWDLRRRRVEVEFTCNGYYRIDPSKDNVRPKGGRASGP